MQTFVHVDHAFEQGRGAGQVLSFGGWQVGCVDALLAFSGAACLVCGEDYGGLARDGAVIWRNAKWARERGWHQADVSGVWPAPISRFRRRKIRCILKQSLRPSAGGRQLGL